ncbi:MAG: replication protein A [Methanosarcinaceae archaeon]|nr:replication protein A [Methanosarcinaceae archaeon]
MEVANDIKDKFTELGVDIPVEQIEDRLNKLITKFKVPQDEARRSVVNYFLKEYDIDRSRFYSGQSSTTLVSIADINEDGQWVNVKAKVVQLWDNSHESISQVGLVGDETGTVKFTKWSRDDLPDVEEGKTYLFNNVVVHEWNGKFAINLNKTSSIEVLDEDLNVGNIPTGDPLSTSMATVEEMNEDGKWANIKAKVVQLWDNSHESISQVGLVGDETGTIKFNKWLRDDLLDVEEGKTYLFNNVVVHEWNGKFAINLNKTSSIEALDEDIEVGTTTVTFTGAMVDVQAGSGLIKRCPECNRALTKGACMEHGKVDGVYDLRIKAVLDDGVTAQDAIIKRDISQELVGMTLDEAVSLAADALDQGVVLERMRSMLIGKYYTIEGSRLDRYILVDSIDQISELNMALVDELIRDTEVV